METIEKAKKNLAKLTKKVITNKKGHKQSVWVKTGAKEKAKGKPTYSDYENSLDIIQEANPNKQWGWVKKQLDRAVNNILSESLGKKDLKEKHYKNLLSAEFGISAKAYAKAKENVEQNRADEDEIHEHNKAKPKAPYKVVEGKDHYNNKPLFQVSGTDNDYVGEWHTSKKDAHSELNSLTSDSKKKDIESTAKAKGNKYETKVYHDTYGSAIDEVVKDAKSRGYEVDQDDLIFAFGDAFFKPKNGETRRKSVGLTKDGKVQKKEMHVQIYNTGNKFEYNAYVN